MNGGPKWPVNSQNAPLANEEDLDNNELTSLTINNVNIKYS